MSRVLGFVYGVASYLFFLAVFVYFIGFLGDLLAPKSVSSGAGGGGLLAILWDVLLLVLFGVQHSVMARPAFKKAWTKTVPWHLERSTYVLASSLALSFVMLAWQPVNVVLWHFTGTEAQVALYGLFFLGWTIIFVATFLTDHFDLFGLRQVYFSLIGRPYAPVKFTSRLFYKHIRHPMMTGIVISFWATPYMTLGHAVFAAVFTAYVGFGVMLEERDLEKHLGADYKRYRASTPKFIPGLKP
jgi:methanethiol S-methyltransferase